MVSEPDTTRLLKGELKTQHSINKFKLANSFTVLKAVLKKVKNAQK